MNRVVFGIDYGSKFSGNTVICIFDHAKVYFMQVEKNVDADEFVLNAARHYKPQHIFLDAPLSLPGVYSGLQDFNDYNFREADRKLNAMSPMFLGGLTARAMRLKADLGALGIPLLETYPKILARQFGLENLGYKGGKSCLIACRSHLMEQWNPKILIDCQDVISWHHLDAWLALMSALRHVCGQCSVYGSREEGLVYV